MQRSLIPAVLCLSLGACADDLTRCSSGVVEMATYASPRSLVDEAREVRASGGLVVRGRVDALAPEVVFWLPHVTDVWVATPTRTATLTITDALGEAVESTLPVRGRSGTDRVVDDRGCPNGLIVSGANGLPQHWIPAAGEYVFWLVRRPNGPWLLHWHAPIVDGQVSGVGAVDARDAPLSSLRR